MNMYNLIYHRVNNLWTMNTKINIPVCSEYEHLYVYTFLSYIFFLTINLTVSKCIMEPFLQSTELWREQHIATKAAHSSHAVVLSVRVFCHHAQTECQCLDHMNIKLITH